jgi:hypothetical protein
MNSGTGRRPMMPQRQKRRGNDKKIDDKGMSQNVLAEGGAARPTGQNPKPAMTTPPYQ